MYTFMQMASKTVKMGNAWKCFLLSLALFMLINRSAEAAVYQPVVSLERMCDRNVTIPCPPAAARGMAGTVRFHFIPDGDCNVTLTLGKGCGSSYDTYAVYINIRKFVLPRSDSIKVSELSADGRLVVHKDLTGSQSGSSRPLSVAQLMTSYSRQPALQIYYTRNFSPSTYSHEAYFDYVIVEKQAKYWSSYCSALSGHVHDDLICDTDGFTDRINCPGNFGLHLSTQTNPAYSRQCTSGVTTPMYYWTSTQQYYYPNNDDGLSDGAVAGIAIGVVFFIVCLIGIISTISSNRHAVTRPVVFSSTPGTVNISTPSVVGNHAPSSAGPAAPFMGAPPSYAEVTAPNSNFPVAPASNNSFSAPYAPNSSFPMPAVSKY